MPELTAEQMEKMGRLKMDFIGWQQGAKDETYILCNDRESNNATYAFPHNASPIDILVHVVNKRKEFRKEL